MIKAVLLTSTDGFVIRGMQKKIEDLLDAEVVSCGIDATDLRSKKEGATVFIYYMDNDLDIKEDVLLYLKEICLERDNKVILVGEDENIKNAEELLSDYLIADRFTRPFDMQDLLAALQKTDDIFGFLTKEEQIKRRILIIDDDPSYSMMIHSWLKDRYLISMASSGMQALKWLSQNHADLVLLDYEMPVTTGAQVLEMIRSDEDLKDIPVMFLTGKNDEKSIRSVLALKPIDYILKTITRDDLRDKLEEYFEF